MKDIKQQAFPTEQHATNDMKGMTLRDYFAAKVMQALAQSELDDADVAKIAYRMADAMMEARK